MLRTARHEIEERRLAPVEVLEHHDQRAMRGKGHEQATDRRKQDRRQAAKRCERDVAVVIAFLTGQRVATY